MKSTPAPLLLHIHLPKCGGTTLFEILQSQLPDGQSRWIDGFNPTERERLLELAGWNISELKVLSGHFSFGFHTHFTRPCRYITVLRNPVERVISHYYYVCEQPDNYLHDLVVGSKMSLRDFTNSTEILDGENVYVRWLADYCDPEPCGEAEYLKARENLLRHFDLVGILDRFSETLRRLTNLLGSGVTLEEIEPRNCTRYRPPAALVDPETLAAIRQRNRYDLRLYGEFAAQFAG